MSCVTVKMPRSVPPERLASYAQELPGLQAELRRLQRRMVSIEASLLTGQEMVPVVCDLDDNNVLRRADTGEVLERRGVQLCMFEEEGDE